MAALLNFVMWSSGVADTKFCVHSPQVFFICDTALHRKVVTKNLHCTVLQRKSYT